MTIEHVRQFRESIKSRIAADFAAAQAKKEEQAKQNGAHLPLTSLVSSTSVPRPSSNEPTLNTPSLDAVPPPSSEESSAKEIAPSSSGESGSDGRQSSAHELVQEASETMFNV